jgi:hypothetical protein
MEIYIMLDWLFSVFFVSGLRCQTLHVETTVQYILPDESGSDMQTLISSPQRPEQLYLF